MCRTETDGLYEGECNFLCPTDGSFLTKNYECRNLCDLITVEQGKPLMIYGKEFYRDIPAVVENYYGNGIAYYIGADVEQGFYEEFYSHLVEKMEIPSIIKGTIPKGVEVSKRSGEKADYIFVQNFSKESVDISDMRVEGQILYGTNKNNLAGYESLVVKIGK